MSEREPQTEIGRAAVDILMKSLASRQGTIAAQCIGSKQSVRDEIERIFDTAKVKYLLDVK